MRAPTEVTAPSSNRDGADTNGFDTGRFLAASQQNRLPPDTTTGHLPEAAFIDLQLALPPAVQERETGKVAARVGLEEHSGFSGSIDQNAAHWRGHPTAMSQGPLRVSATFELNVTLPTPNVGAIILEPTVRATASEQPTSTDIQTHDRVSPVAHQRMTAAPMAGAMPVKEAVVVTPPPVAVAQEPAASQDTKTERKLTGMDGRPVARRLPEPQPPPLDPRIDIAQIPNTARSVYMAQLSQGLKDIRLAVRSDDGELGTVGVKMANGAVLVHVGQVLDLFEGNIPQERFAQLRQSGAAEQYIGLDRVQAAGIPLSYDPVYDELVLSASRS